jgi:hypothetical protein
VELKKRERKGERKKSKTSFYRRVLFQCSLKASLSINRNGFMTSRLLQLAE